MALIKKLKGFVPKFGKDNFLAENATIIGDVVTGDNCSCLLYTSDAADE